jgi:hypothetical protein
MDGHDGGPTRVYGVDFSAAAADAGQKTWIASGRVDEDGLRIAGVAPLVEFAGLEAAGREPSVSALADWLGGLGEDAVVGLDVPFGLPRFVVEATDNGSWREFVRGFPASIGVDEDDRAGDPVRAFAERCVELTDAHGEGTYDKRETDAVVGARSPYGFIADTIAFYGMRDVLGAVVDDVRVAPMDVGPDGWLAAALSGPVVVETYPAAILDRCGLCRTGYKGSGDDETARRTRNAEGVESQPAVSYAADAAIRETAVNDAGGDAVDAVAACVGAFDAAREGYATETEAFDDPEAVEVEGYIYA